jgi:beta-fructofuranosidase
MLILPDHWTWDFWLTEADECYHLYFLMAPISLGDPELRHRNARIGHAVSRDLREWEFLGEALGPGAPGAWDDLATWTGSVIRVADGWQMYYTGVNRAENGLVQRIGRATSTDLHEWTKDDGFVLEVDERWYEQLDLDVWFDLTWRDPWVYFDEDAGEYRMLVTARAREGAVDARGVVGLARSSSLDEWEVLPPIASPSEFGHMEVPQLERIGDRWYLFFSAYEWAHSARRVDAGLAVCGTHYLVADSASGPFTLQSQDFLSGDARGELYAGRVVRTVEGEHVFLAFLQFVDGGPFVGGLSDPFPITVDASGLLRIERDGDWSDLVAPALMAARPA